MRRRTRWWSRRRRRCRRSRRSPRRRAPAAPRPAVAAPSARSRAACWIYLGWYVNGSYIHHPHGGGSTVAGAGASAGGTLRCLQLVDDDVAVDDDRAVIELQRAAAHRHVDVTLRRVRAAELLVRSGREQDVPVERARVHADPALVVGEHAPLGGLEHPPADVRDP